VLCSPAQRAAETLALAQAQLETQPEVEVRADLYLDGWTALLDAVHGLPDRVSRAMLVGHNPDLQDLACRLAGSGSSDARQAMAAKFPTGALAVIAFPGPSWGEVALGAGTLRAFVRPRDLT
jgi:phosphohistidine phosphatase